MEAKNLYCEGCAKYMGEVRDATLRKGMVVLCDKCETKRKLAAMAMNHAGSRSNVDKLKDVFGW